MEFGDAITLRSRELTLGPMPDLPAPRLRTCPPETVVAEKLHAIIVLGMANSRMQDYFDLWTLRQTMAFGMTPLRAATEATLEPRSTPIPTTLPVGLTESFTEDESERKQWAGFTRKMTVDARGTPPLAGVVGLVQAFLEPLLIAMSDPGANSRPAGWPWIPSSDVAAGARDT